MSVCRYKLSLIVPGKAIAYPCGLNLNKSVVSQVLKGHSRPNTLAYFNILLIVAIKYFKIQGIVLNLGVALMSCLTRGATTLCFMTLSIATLSLMVLGKMALSLMSLTYLQLAYWNSVYDTQHNNIQHNGRA